MATTVSNPPQPSLLPRHVRTPSLDNQTRQQWDRHTQVSYLFARHARHDMANIHCTLRMFEMVQSMGADGDDDTPLPPDLQPDAIKAKTEADIKKLISLSNDMALLSQAVNPWAYQPSHTRSISGLLDDAILSRLDTDHPAPNQGVLERVDGYSILVLGDALVAALGAFYFQWTPWMTAHTQASQMTAQITDQQLTLAFPADDTESVASFARRLHSKESGPLASVADQALSLTTTELALWMARFIVLIHGGGVNADPNDPLLTLRVTLPITG